MKNVGQFCHIDLALCRVSGVGAGGWIGKLGCLTPEAMAVEIRIFAS